MVNLAWLLPISLADAANARASLSFWYTALSIVLLINARRKKRVYGMVFDASTLKPLAYAIVALLRPNGAVTRTAVTDEKGRYRLAAPEGDYRIAVSRSDYLSVSARHKGRKTVGKYRRLYGGGPIHVTHEEPIVSPDIPMEPKNPGSLSWGALADVVWNRLDAYVMGLFLLLTVLWALVAPEPRAVMSLAIESVAYIIFRFPWKSAVHRWGIVKNAHSGKPVPYAKVELVDASTAQQIDTAATDLSGRYNFLIEGYRKMYIRCRRPGYRSFRSDTLRFLGLRTETVDLVGLDINLDPDPASTPEQRGEMVKIFELTHEALATGQKTAVSEKKG